MGVAPPREGRQGRGNAFREALERPFVGPSFTKFLAVESSSTFTVLLVVAGLAKRNKVAHYEPKGRIDLYWYNMVDLTRRLCASL